MLITIGAMIGAGKSSLAAILGEHFGTDVFYESVDDNPILPLFYTASDEEIQAKRYPFLLQLWFLDTRFKSIKEALVNDNNVLDRSIYEDWYFAKVNKDLGRISELEFSLYEGLLNNMLEEIEGMPKKAPDLMIYLHGSFEKIIERIQKRGRDYELDEGLIEYYRTLWEGYDDWINEHYKASEVLFIDIDKYDYVNNADDRAAVIKLVEDKLREVRGGEDMITNTEIAKVNCNAYSRDSLRIRVDFEGDVEFSITEDEKTNYVFMTQERAIKLAQQILFTLEG